MSTTTSTAPTRADYYEGLVTGAELCKQLKITSKYLRWLRRRHGLPSVKVGSEVRFYPDDVNAWLAKRAARAKARRRAPGNLAAGLRAKLDARVEQALREQIVILALFRGTEEGPIANAIHSVGDLRGQGILLAVNDAVRTLNEAGGIVTRSFLYDQGTGGAVAQAQVDAARSNREQTAMAIADQIRRSTTTATEAMERIIQGDWSFTAVRGDSVAEITLGVLALRELYAGAPSPYEDSRS